MIEPTEAEWLEGNDPMTERERMEAAMADNRTNEPNQNETKSGQEFCFTEAQVEAAANAFEEHLPLTSGALAGTGTYWCAECRKNIGPINKARRHALSATLVAAAATPQAESDGAVTCRCRHGVGAHDFSDPSERCRMVGCRCQGWFGVAPVLPSSTVDELAKLIRRLAVRVHVPDPDGLWSDCYDSEQKEWQSVARAVVEAIGGESHG